MGAVGGGGDGDGLFLSSGSKSGAHFEFQSARLGWLTIAVMLLASVRVFSHHCCSVVIRLSASGRSAQLPAAAYAPSVQRTLSVSRTSLVVVVVILILSTLLENSKRSQHEDHKDQAEP